MHQKESQDKITRMPNIPESNMEEIFHTYSEY